MESIRFPYILKKSFVPCDDWWEPIYAWKTNPSWRLSVCIQTYFTICEHEKENTVRSIWKWMKLNNHWCYMYIYWELNIQWDPMNITSEGRHLKISITLDLDSRLQNCSNFDFLLSTLNLFVYIMYSWYTDTWGLCTGWTIPCTWEEWSDGTTLQ